MALWGNVTDDWWRDPEPEPDGWTRGELLLCLLLPVGSLVAVVIVWWLETLLGYSNHIG